MPALPIHDAAPRRLTVALYSYLFLQDFILLYPFYALLFADTGLSVAQITALFIAGAITVIVFEVPSGALADVLPRRWLIAAAPLFAGVAFALWVIAPSFEVFLLGFILWGFGGTLSSGALEALVYTELEQHGTAGRYAAVMGLAQAFGVFAVGASTLLAIPAMNVGGYTLVAIGSVAACVACAIAGLAMPETRRAAAPVLPGNADHARGGYLGTIRAGIQEVRADHRLLAVIGLVAIIPAVWESLEEYVPLLAAEHGVATADVPWVVFAVWAGVGLGGALTGRFSGLTARGTALMLAGSTLLGSLGAVLGGPIGWIALGIAFGGFQITSVLAEAWMQDRIRGTSRATITSIAGVASEILAIAVLLAYAIAVLLAYAGVQPLGSHAGAFALLLLVPYLVAAVLLWRSSGPRSPAAAARATRS
ncbi:MFS transporter [Hoyosella sp. G463]|uniref:MFS transporter n=1 Tax=Lolliginicoccus lacisalsi TaxID=2742202 RepID=A0A927JE16_9ACTN|nr:MFS transporter [Lolliginicoccus lacisalsi]MBD8507581.1 MFS transporter [Lolliginicoccus lacisalsi]